MSGFTRRQWIRTTAAGTLALATPRSARRPPRRVVVVGAGLAGLAAADALVAHGDHVTVFEARSEPGGRVRTLRRPFSGALHAEAGATFIPGHHRRVRAAARRFGLALVPFEGADFRARYVGTDRVYAGDPGGPFEWPFDLTPEEREAGYYGLMYQHLGPPLDALGDPDDPDWPPARLLPLDALSFGDFLRDRGASAATVDVLSQGFISTWGDGPDSVSALFMLQAVAAHTSASDLYRLDGGNDRLPQALADALGDRVRYDAPVHRVEAGAEGTRVRWTDGGLERATLADAVVMAVPPAAVRRIALDPPLPPARREAFERVPSTDVVRTYLELTEAPWPLGGGPGAWSPAAAPAGNVREATVGQPGPGSVVESFSAGPLARRLGGMAEAERAQSLAEFLAGPYPSLPDRVRTSASVAWQSEPYAWGAYTWPRPGEVTGAFRHLAPSHGAVHFAGDHLSSLNGWMEGALASGAQVARRLASDTSA